MNVNKKRSAEVPLQIVIEFVEVLHHQILYLRALYPDTIFESRRKFQLPVKMSVHPGVNKYLETTLEAIKTALGKPDTDISSIDLVIANSEGQKKHQVLEVYKLELETLSEFVLESGDQFLVGLEMGLASMVSRLNQAVSILPPPPCSGDNRGWWLELGTTQRGALRLGIGSQEWCLAGGGDSDGIMINDGRTILPVMALDKPFKIQLYIEKG